MSRRDWSTANFLRLGSGVLTAAPLTMAAWCQTSDVSGSQQEIVGLYASATAATRNQFALWASSGTLFAGTGDASANSSALKGSFVANTWFHAGGVFASATSRAAYLNGAKATNATSRTPSGINRTSIGVDDSSSAATPFAPAGTGDIAEVAIWNIALSDADMVRLASGIRPYAVHREALVAYWRLDGGGGTEFNFANPNQPQTLQGALSLSAPPSIVFSPQLILQPGLVV